MHVKKAEYRPVQVVEERHEVEAKFYKTLLLVPRKRAEYFGGVVHVVLVSYPVQVSLGTICEHV